MHRTILLPNNFILTVTIHVKEILTSKICFMHMYMYKNVFMNDYHSWFELIGQNTFLPQKINKISKMMIVT